MEDKKKLIIIGAGPGGYAAAFQASTLGLDVTLIDPKINPGGVCLYHGCIPTKALLHLASVRGDAEHAAEAGFAFSEVKVDLSKVRSWKESVVKQLTDGLGLLAKSHKVNYLRGTARITGKNKLEYKPVEGEAKELEFENLIIATGASSAELKGIPFEDLIMDAEASLRLDDIPRRLLIVGAGYIGLEMAVIYKSLGSGITIAEFTPDILPGADKDLKDVFRKERSDLLENAMFDTKVTSIIRKGKELHAEFETGSGEKKQGVFDKALVAIGSKPNTSGIGLEDAGIKVDEKGFIPVDIFRRTSVENIYAIGDITGQPMLAHKATSEGRVAAEHIAGHKTAFEPKAIPAIIYTDPEIAWAGLTENEAKQQGREIDVVKYPWSVSGRAVTMGIKSGLTKLIIEKGTERLLGAGIAGKDAGSLLPEIMVALEMSAVVRDLELTIHPHPTLSETIMEAAELYYGQATHMFKKSRQSKMH